MRRLLLLLIPLCLSMAPTAPESPPAATVTLPPVGIDPATSLPTPERFADLAQTDPVKMLELCIARHQREVKGYRAVLDRRERIEGELRDREVVKAAFREEPFSVLMRWEEGADRAAAMLFIAGENKDKILIRPKNQVANFLVSYVTRDPENKEVRSQSRYGVRDFGILKGTARTYNAWKAAQRNGTFRFEHLGVRSVKEAGDRRCHIIRRLVDPPEEEGLTDVTIAIDVETWLQVDSRLMAGKYLIAEYHFRDIERNPMFGPDQFKPEALKE